MVRSMTLLATVFALSSWALIEGDSQAYDKPAGISPSTTIEGTLLAQAEPKPKTRKAPAGRIPNGWGKLGLSTEQKKSVYAIQAEYKDQLEELERQIAELKMKQMEEMEGVLTAEQLAKLRAQTKTSKPAGETEKSDVKPETSANSK